MIYITREEIREAELRIGNFLLSLPEEDIDSIKDRCIVSGRGMDREESIMYFEWCLTDDVIFGYYLDRDDIAKASNIVRAFYLKLQREKYPRQYRGGILNTDNTQWQRNYRHWKKRVFERDGYKCVICGVNKKLCAHHIKERSIYPEFEFDIDNGITLCTKHHAEKHPKLMPLISGAK